MNIGDDSTYKMVYTMVDIAPIYGDYRGWYYLATAIGP